MDERHNNQGSVRGDTDPTAQNRIHWHEAFYEVLQVELRRYRDILRFMTEYLLSKEALKMDVLIIKKEKDVEIEKNIGRIFKTYNIFEYKSETDYLSIYDYYKVLGYALIYASFEKVRKEDITVSFVVTKHPRELFKYLENVCKLKIDNVEDGIYYICGDTVSVQILEQKKLSSKDNFFLKNLGSNISLDDAINILQEWEKLGGLSSRSKMIETMFLANQEIFKEAGSMSMALIDIIMEVAQEPGSPVKNVILEAARKKGWLEEVKSEFAMRERVGIAIEMLKMGLSAEQVSLATKLTIENVREIESDLQ